MSFSCHVLKLWLALAGSHGRDPLYNDMQCESTSLFEAAASCFCSMPPRCSLGKGNEWPWPIYYPQASSTSFLAENHSLFPAIATALHFQLGTGCLGRTVALGCGAETESPGWHLQLHTANHQHRACMQLCCPWGWARNSAHTSPHSLVQSLSMLPCLYFPVPFSSPFSQ